jgi:hypothetical protein
MPSGPLLPKRRDLWSNATRTRINFPVGSTSDQRSVTRPSRTQKRPVPRPVPIQVSSQTTGGSNVAIPAGIPTVSVPSHSFSPVPQFQSRPTVSVPSHGFSPVPRVQSRPTGSVREAIRSAALRVAAYRGFVATRSRSSRAHRDRYPSRKRPSSQSYPRKADSPRPSFYAHINNFESFSPRVGARLPPSLGREERTLDRCGRSSRDSLPV